MLSFQFRGLPWASRVAKTANFGLPTSTRKKDDSCGETEHDKLAKYQHLNINILGEG
jgi:hypothetical protein